MNEMLICRYCECNFEKIEPYCPCCGAAIPRPVEANLNPEQQLTEICSQYEDVTCCYLEGTIPDKKHRNATQAFEIPKAEKIFMLCDTTLFGSNNLGFAICQSGLYWKNDWTTPTKRSYLTWAEFAKRKLSIDGYAIDLERGDKIDLSGVGDDKESARILAMLKEIQSHL